MSDSTLGDPNVTHSPHRIDQTNAIDAALEGVLGTMLDDYLLKPLGTVEEESLGPLVVRKFYPGHVRAKMAVIAVGHRRSKFIEPWNITMAAHARIMNRKVPQEK